MRRLSVLSLPLVLAIAACGLSGTDRYEEEKSGASAKAGERDPMASSDPQAGATADPAMADDKPRPVMQAQVVLDRLGFTPGVVDGKMGLSTRNALLGFQEANELNQSGELDEATKAALAQWSNISATRVVTIPEEFAAGPFTPVPDDPAEQAKLERLGYESLDEKLAERFHTTMEVLRELNPQLGVATASASPTATGAAPASPLPPPNRASGSATPMPTASASPSLFAAGMKVRVPNIGADAIDASKVEDAKWLATLRSLGVGSEQPQAARIVVSKSKGTLKAYDAQDKLVAMYTATMGSENDPLPLGEWKITTVAHNPPFAYNPELFWDVPDTDEKQQLPPGPNGPVGVVWIDLSKEHYGIHGTPEPQTIGRAQSHGCVRLTNWDAARLAGMVSSSTKVLFEA